MKMNADHMNLKFNTNRKEPVRTEDIVQNNIADSDVVFNEFDCMDMDYDNTIDNYVNDLPDRRKKYHQFKTISLTNDIERKKALVSALTSPDYINSEMLNLTINCIGFYTDYTMCNDRILLRVILIDDKLKSYSTLSQGIARDICNWIDNDLEPTEDYPVKWQVVMKRKGAYGFYVLQEVKE